MKTQEKTEVAVKTTADVPMAVDMEQFAGAGAENISSKDVSLPFLKILTNNSILNSKKYNPKIIAYSWLKLLK